MPDDSKSVGWVAWALALVVAAAGWGFLAADFFQHDPAARGVGKADFFVNAVEQLPNFPKVMNYALANRAWAFVVIGALEAGVLILGLVMKKLEGQLQGRPKPWRIGGRRG